MTTKKLLIIAFFLFAAVGVIGFFLFDFSTARQPYDAVPPTAALVLETPKTGQLLLQLSEQCDYAASLSEMDFYAQSSAALLMLDSLTSRANPGFRSAFYDLPAIAALLETSHGYSFVFILKADHNLRMYAIREAVPRVFGNKMSVVARKIGKHATEALIYQNGSRQLNYYINRGLLIVSSDREAFEMALLQLDNPNKITSDPAFSRMKAIAGKQTDGCLMIHPQAIDKLFEANALHEYRPLIGGLLEAAGGWAAFDLGIKKEYLSLNGFLQTTKGSILEGILKHKPRTASLFACMPYDTRLFMHFGMEGLNDYLSRFSDSLRLEVLSGLAGTDIRELQQALGNEIAVGFRPGSANENVFLVALLAQPELMRQKLLQISKAVSATDIRQIENPLLQNLPSALWGTAFGLIDRMNYLIVDSCLFAANDPILISQLAQLRAKGKTLGNQDSFQTFSSKLTASSNILLYSSLHDGPELLNAFLDPRLGYQLNRNQLPLSRFGGMALQISAASPMLYGNAIAIYQPNISDAGLMAWQMPVEAPLIGKPDIVQSNDESRIGIAACDASGILYYLNAEGRIIWKKQLQSPIIGKINTLSFGKQKAVHLLFNTAGQIHLIDLKGKEAQGFPVQLRSPATNPLSVSVLGNELRILISCADRTTYCYGADGRENPFWEKPRSQNTVSSEVVQLRTTSQSYIVICDEQNGVLITDNNGKNRIPLKGAFKKSKNAQVYLNKTNSKGVLLTTNEQGKLLYISGTAALSTTDFGTYGPDHFFLYEDFDQNSTADFIFLDGKKLQIFDRFKKVLFSYNFANEIVTPPAFITITNGMRFLCVADEIAGELYLIDSKGRMMISSGLRGHVPFAVGSKNGLDELILVSGLGEKIVCYQAY